MSKKLLFIFVAYLSGCSQSEKSNPVVQLPEGPYIKILGIAQDGGYPQAGCKKHNCSLYWDGKEEKRHVSSMAIIDPQSNKAWMIDATPDFREQLQILTGYDLAGIFITHGHMGHYTGLMHLGHEAMGAEGILVYVMPRMKSFLEENGPWSQLVDYNNITLVPISDSISVKLTNEVAITPFTVPHRDEFTETVGYRISGSNKKIIFIPDIDKWEKWEHDIIKVVEKVDFAFLDGSFYGPGEIPGRDMSQFPHPFISESIEKFADLPAKDKRKIHFIHFNHTNPVLIETSPEHKEVHLAGFMIANETQVIEL